MGSQLLALTHQQSLSMESMNSQEGTGLIVAEAVDQGTQLVYRLTSNTALHTMFVDANELAQWPRVENYIYLVKLCTTPPTLGHVAPYRHDYRKSHGPYVKGDLVVVDGKKPGMQDVGV